jgi:hypothetical protein
LPNFPLPVLRNRTIPAPQHKFLAREIAHPRPLNCYLADMKANLALGSAPAVSPPSLAADVATPQASSASFSIITPSASTPAATRNRSKLAATSSQAWPTTPVSVGAKAIDVVPWRCFPFVESAPRAYRLKASNAAPPISTFAGAIPELAFDSAQMIPGTLRNYQAGPERRQER